MPVFVSRFTVSINGQIGLRSQLTVYTSHVGGSNKSVHRDVLILDHERPETAEEEEEEEEEEHLPNDFDPEEVNRGGSDDEEKVVQHAATPRAMSSSQPNQDLCSHGSDFDCELLSVLVLSFHYVLQNPGTDMMK